MLMISNRAIQSYVHYKYQDIAWIFVNHCYHLTLCAIFDLGDMHVVVGNKQGALMLLELASDDCVWK